MESPVKKLDYTSIDKENRPFDAAVEDLAKDMDSHKTEAPILEVTKVEKPTVAVVPNIKPEEADEPLLRENPQRFVLFPIKYHEVRVTSRYNASPLTR